MGLKHGVRLALVEVARRTVALHRPDPHGAGIRRGEGGSQHEEHESRGNRQQGCRGERRGSLRRAAGAPHPPASDLQRHLDGGRTEEDHQERETADADPRCDVRERALRLTHADAAPREPGVRPPAEPQLAGRPQSRDERRKSEAARAAPRCDPRKPPVGERDRDRPHGAEDRLHTREREPRHRTEVPRDPDDVDEVEAGREGGSHGQCPRRGASDQSHEGCRHPDERERPPADVGESQIEDDAPGDGDEDGRPQRQERSIG